MDKFTQTTIERFELTKNSLEAKKQVVLAKIKKLTEKHVEDLKLIETKIQALETSIESFKKVMEINADNSAVIPDADLQEGGPVTTHNEPVVTCREPQTDAPSIEDFLTTPSEQPVEEVPTPEATEADAIFPIN